MKPSCENFVLNVLPGLRAMLIHELLYEYGLTQTNAAELTGVTQAAVSQYSRAKRGRRKSSEVKNEISVIAKKLIDLKINKTDLDDEFCGLCKMISKTGCK
ncbi:MAG: XRE family transcriptional regulator [Candidatus Aenigmatarchaeota archaeon]